MVKNNIKTMLDANGISIHQLSAAINITYAAAYALVNRKYIDFSRISTIIKVAAYLNIDIKDLYNAEMYKVVANGATAAVFDTLDAANAYVKNNKDNSITYTIVAVAA